MCGICGIINHKNNSDYKKIVERMRDNLSHRGPDQKGLFIDENFANIRGPGEAIGIHSGAHEGTQRGHYSSDWRRLYLCWQSDWDYLFPNLPADGKFQ